ncbi:energy transducer TonB [Echinicola sp. CAU 1574]|uniref:Energy transducer TonB n=1 Tax=Echinicola arenosa TaxID=2774144 RepID=A0ABR9AP20_9BACT|nr:energy transducer TonB [Echinicola arenosa]MBD8489364.1 energy transducer TonB [Echinicola arenosa]
MEVQSINKEELDSKKKATIITIIVNVLVLVGIYFIVVWRPPVPPMAQFGLELNLGFTNAGSGNNQTETPPSESEQINTESPAPGTPVEQVTEPAQPVVQPETKPAAKPQPIESKSSLETKSNVTSPLKGAEKTTEAVKETNQPKETSKPVTQPAEKEEKKVEEKVEEKPKIDQRAILGAGGNKGRSSESSAGSSQGTSTQKGDQGNPEGTIDGRSIMQSGQGNAGNGAGYNLDLAGWDFASKPNIQDRVSNRNGRIVFKIVVDDNGRIAQAIPLEYNVSNEVLAYYRGVVNKLNFKRKSGNPTAEYSEGKITFIIKVD